MKEHDPPPLTDPAAGAPSLLRDALLTARAEGPSAQQLAALAARLPLVMPPPAGPSGGAPPAMAPPAMEPPAVAPPAVAAPSVLSGALIGAALGVLVSGAGLWWPSGGEAPRTSAPQGVVTAVADAPRQMPRAPTASPADAPAPAATAASAPRPSQLAASAAVNGASSAPALDAPTAPSAEPAPESGSPGAGAQPGPADTETEAHFLQRAQSAVDASPAQALAMTEQHASRFPAGTLGQEREVVAIQALMRLGRTDEARARGARFVAAFPGSAHRRRLEALLGR